VALVVAAAGAAALIAASGNPGSSQALIATARAAIVGIPIAVGLGIWLRAANDRLGPLLVAVGGVCLLTTLSESSDEALYTLGRASGWFLEVLLVYVILSFPTGRLSGRVDRLLVAGMGLTVVVLFLPRLLIAESFQIPSPYTSCTSDCPGNALFVLDRQPGIVDAVILPLGMLVTVGLMTAVLVRLWLRLGDATVMARRMLVPVLAVGAARLAAVVGGFVVRDADPDAWVTSAVAWAIPLAVPLLALAFLLGFVRWRLFIGDALERFAELLRQASGPDGVRKAFASAFRDPSVEIAMPSRDRPGQWFDSLGNRIALPATGSHSAVTLVERHGATVAAVIHDAALDTDPRVVAAAAGMAGVVLDNQRLAAETDAAMREVHKSRGRIAATAERERRRIERDLHDSAQQRLVALRIELELAENLVRDDPERGIERLKELEAGLDEALEEIRSLAHGVYPPLLADRGLAEALHPAARHCGIPVRLETFEIGRYAPEVESAVYFCVLEALQNAMKHATGARTLWVRIDGSSGDQVTFSVRDDGAGAPGGRIEAGMGIVNMRDRLHSVGGELEIRSAPGVGTTVRGRLPSPAAGDAPSTAGVVGPG
jgi:signal transduction histidine kinase